MWLASAATLTEITKQQTCLIWFTPTHLTDANCVVGGCRACCKSGVGSAMARTLCWQGHSCMEKKEKHVGNFFLTPPPNCIATSMQHCLLAMSQGCQNVTMLDSQTMASIPPAKHHHQILDSKCTETGASKGPGLALPLQKRERLLAASHPSVCHLCACQFCKTKRVSLLGAGQFSTHPANSVGNHSSPPHLLWAMSSQEAVLQKQKTIIK
jgi:hypothetical protein